MLRIIRLYKRFDSFDAAQKFVKEKRVTVPIHYKTLKKFEHNWAGPNPVDFLEISSSSESENVQDENAFQSDDSQVRFLSKIVTLFSLCPISNALLIV